MCCNTLFRIERQRDTTAVALFSGVGKVNAAVAVQILIDCFGVTAVINYGTAGQTERIF